MECEKARDRFSSLWERELSSFEEKILEEHLASCPECRREFEQFGKTMRWLRSVEEVEVPEGFLDELYKKREERKSSIMGEEPRRRWPRFPLSFKLPVQAVAMVVIVFLVLYLTKMVPMEGGRLTEKKQTSSPLSVLEKPEQGLTPSATPPRPEPFDGLKALSSDRAKALIPEEKKKEETYAPEIHPPKGGVMAYRQAEPKGAGREESPLREPGKIGRELAVREKSVVASKPPQEIILKTSDRKRVIPQLHELVKQFGGEVVATEGDMILASLPTGSFAEFEKELAGFSSSAKADRLIAEKHAAGSLRLEEGAKRKEGDVRSKAPANPAADTGDRTTVRILLVEE